MDVKRPVVSGAGRSARSVGGSVDGREFGRSALAALLSSVMVAGPLPGMPAGQSLPTHSFPCGPGARAGAIAAPGPSAPIRATPDLPLLIERLRCRVGAPGLTVAVADSYGIRVHATGWADVEHHVPVGENTRFRLASTSKAVTAVALAALADRGVVELDRPIGDYLRDLPAHLRPITPRQLAGHLAGVRHYEPKDSAIDLRHFETTREALDLFVHDPLRFEPGTDHGYSTFGYTLLGAVMEAAADASLEAIIRRYVAAPLWLETLGPDDPRELTPSRSGFYERAGSGELRRAEYVDPSYKVAGGGLLASAGDLARLGWALLEGELGLSARTRDALFTSQRTTSGVETGVGLGWRVGVDPFGREVWHHEGSMGGARSALLLYPADSLVVALLSNLTGTPFFAFETSASLAASLLAPREDLACAEDAGRTYTGAVTIDGREADARLLLRTTEDGLRGTLELGELPLPVDPSVAIEDGWCREREMVLVLGIGPTSGFVPLILARTADGWAGSIELQGGHSLSLRVGAR